MLVADVDTLTALPWKGSFDAIICMDFSEHLKNPERALRMLRDYRAGWAGRGNAAQRGQLVIVSGCWWEMADDDPGIGSDSPALFDLTGARASEKAGYTIEAMDVTPGVGAWAPYHYTIGALLRAFGLAERVDYRLSRWFPRLFAYQFIFSARAGHNA